MNLPTSLLPICLALVVLTVPSRAEFRAGVARADLTPPLGGHMYGYGDRGDNVSTGVTIRSTPRRW